MPMKPSYSSRLDTAQTSLSGSAEDYYVSLEAVEKIYRVLVGKVDDIMDFIPDGPTPEQGTGTNNTLIH